MVGPFRTSRYDIFMTLKKVSEMNVEEKIERIKAERGRIVYKLNKERKQYRGLRGELREMKVTQGDRYSQWAGEVHKLGKKLRQADPGIRC